MINSLFAITAALLSGIVASAPVPSDDKPCIVNLLTQVNTMSVTSAQGRDENKVAIHHDNATIKYPFDDVDYSLVGSVAFKEVWNSQTFHIETDLWTCDVDLTLVDAKEYQHLDLAVSKDDPSGMKMRFDFLTKDIVEGVNVTRTPKNYACTGAGWDNANKLNQLNLCQPEEYA